MSNIYGHEKNEVKSNHIGDQQIDSDHIKDNSITNSKIQNEAVTVDKMKKTDGSYFDFGSLDLYANKLKFEDGEIFKSFSGNTILEHKGIGGIILSIDSNNKIKIQENNIDFYKSLFIRNNNIEDVSSLHVDNIQHNTSGNNIQIKDPINMNGNNLENIGSLTDNNIITTNNINDNAVTTNKINNGAVTTNKINNGAVTSSKINNGAVTTSKMNIDSALNFNDNNLLNVGVLKSPLKVNSDGVDKSFEITDGVNSSVRIEHLSGSRNFWSVNYNHYLEIGKRESDNSLTTGLKFDHPNDKIESEYQFDFNDNAIVNNDKEIKESSGNGFKFDNTNGYVSHNGTHIYGDINFDSSNTAVNNIQFNAGEIKVLPNNFMTIANTLKMSSNEINNVSNLKTDKIECPEFQDSYLDLTSSTSGSLDYYKHVVISDNNKTLALNNVGSAVFHQFDILNVDSSDRVVDLSYGASSQTINVYDMVSGKTTYNATEAPVTIKKNEIRIITLWGNNDIYIK